ncbi:hypothetical protein BDV27DRAFT_169023 [Aspergillus caelatus]|uniref:Uncharacterized protein n=1 Tax=Aspergillus caelatus TaxID=61420 RepID=A0A5N7AKP1_9EURO|nr:uncharacterized protein BDV27DRAFT_169023 [Aspergillus caelatus]KAE8370462.1 hypothetical protein BDV27DRAFT_169023 [Aspergillus caelatus]
MATSSFEFALTGDYPPISYVNFEDLKARIMSMPDSLIRREVGQHIALKHVAQEEFNFIEDNRGQLGTTVRLSYFPDIQTLIVKVPSREHEKAHVTFGGRMSRKVFMMGVGVLEFQGLGATRYTGSTASTKESDSSWTNDLLRPRSFPMLVIEAGVSESMRRLWADAAWWMANSNGLVNIVLLIKVTKNRRKIDIEKYIPTRALPTRARPAPEYKPLKVSTIRIDPGVNPPRIQGAPLRLEFEKVIGRRPNPPLEKDFVFTAAELLEWARYVFI